jgi:hypothetical protein
LAVQPQFAATPKQGAALLGAAETSLTVPTTTSTIVAGGANGSKIEEIDAQAIGTTVAGLVYIFLYDGATYHIFDTITIPALVASTSVAPFRLFNRYSNLILLSTWSLRCSQSIAGNANIIKVHALGADF